MPETVKALSEMTPAAAKASPSPSGPVQGVLLPDGSPQDRPRSHHRPHAEDTSGDAEFARRLQAQLDAEDGAGAAGPPVAAPVPAPAPALHGDYDSDFRRQADAAAGGGGAAHLLGGAGAGDGVLRGPALVAPVPAPAPAPARREPAPAAAAGAAAGALWPGCKTERAIRYEYDSATKEWNPQADTITVVVHDKQFGEGGLRNVRQLREIDPVDGSYIEYVAKWFKFEVGGYLSLD
jgi:hypothetical protein